MSDNGGLEEEITLLEESQQRRDVGNEESMFQVEREGKLISLKELAEWIIRRQLKGWQSAYAGEALNTALEQYLKSNDRSKKEDDPEKEEKRKKNLMHVIAERKANTLRASLNRIAMIDPEDIKYDGPFQSRKARRISLDTRLGEDEDGVNESIGAVTANPIDSGDPVETVLTREKSRENALIIRGALAALDDPKHRLIISVKFDTRSYLPSREDDLRDNQKIPNKGNYATNKVIAEECGIPLGQVSDQLKNAKKCMSIGLKTLKHPRILSKLEVLVDLLESRVGESRENFAGEVDEAISWAKKNNVEGKDAMSRHVVTSLGPLWEKVDVRGHRLSNEDKVKQRIVAACAAYVSLEEDKTPDKSEKGFRDDFEVISAVRESFGMQIGLKRISARESLKVLYRSVIKSRV